MQSLIMTMLIINLMGHVEQMRGFKHIPGSAIWKRLTLPIFDLLRSG
jgi:hypothetical protein